MDWSVVSFLGEENVEAVPSTWYISAENKCFWPPVQFLSAQVAMLIKSRAVPGDDWDLYNVERLGQYSNYATANKKANKAKTTNALSSQSEDVAGAVTVRGRRVKPNRKYASDENPESSLSSSDANDYSEEDATTYPSFSTKESLSPIKKKKCTERSVSEMATRNINSGESTSQVKEVVHCAGPQQTENFRASTPRIKEGAHCSGGKRNDTSTSTVRDEEVAHFSGRQRTPSQDKPSSSTRVFRQQVLRQLNMINYKLSQHGENLDVLMENRNRPPALSIDENEDCLRDITKLLPLKGVEDVGQVEELLVDNNTSLLLAKELGRMGGATAKEITKKIMYHLFSNEVGQKYSWEGIKKLPFKTLLITKIIFQAVRSNKRTETACDDEIVNPIKQWLVRAKDRANNRRNTQADRQPV